MDSHLVAKTALASAAMKVDERVLLLVVSMVNKMVAKTAGGTAAKMVV